MAAFPDQRVDWLAGPDGITARRSWELAPEVRSVLLRGLLGFPWPHREVHAKCTERDYSRRTTLFGPRLVDRHHDAVPAPHCTCGIYAMEEPETRLTARGFLSRRVLVHGFVRLSGRILFDGTQYRAERARIEGPLIIALPPPRRMTAGRLRYGRARVFETAGRYRIEYGPWARAARDGRSLGSWLDSAALQLAARYEVPVERTELRAAA